MAKIKRTARGTIKKHFMFNGVDYYAYGRTVTEAEQAKTAKIAKLQAGIVDHANPKLNDFYQTFTENRRHSVKQSTLRGQEALYRSMSGIVIYNDVTLGQMRIADIRPRDIISVQAALIASGNNSRTVNDKLSHLSHVFRAAIKLEIIDKNPCHAVNTLKQTEPAVRETKHRALSPEDITLFLEEAKDSYFINLFKLMICTGLRIGEAGALSRADIGTKVIHVTKTVTRLENGSYTIGTPKTNTSTRDIPLTPITKQIIKDQNALNADLYGLSINLSEPIFKNPDGGLLREYAVNREIKRITKRCGLEYFTSHALRNTFATTFYYQIGDVKLLQSLMGHSDIRMTMNIYTHTPLERKTEAMNNFKAI